MRNLRNMLEASRFKLLLVFGTLAVIVGDVTSAAQDSEGTCKKGDDCEGEMRTCMSAECVIISGEILSRMDLTVNPCDDFYLYACGGYSEKEKMNPLRTSTDLMTLKNYDNRLRLFNLLESEDPESKLQHSSSVAKAKKFLQSCLKSPADDYVGRSTAQHLIKRLLSWPLAGNINAKWDGSGAWKLNDALIQAYTMGFHPFLDISLHEDPQNPDRYIIEIKAKGLTLGLASNYNVEGVREGYVRYVVNVLSVIYGKERAEEVEGYADKLWKFERFLSKIFPSKLELESSGSYGNIFTLKDLQAKLKTFNLHYILNGLLKNAGKSIALDQRILVKTPKYLESLANLITRYEQFQPETLSTYIVWISLAGEIPRLSKSFQKAYALYRADVFSEAETKEERTWHECAEFTETAFNEPVAALYLEKYFTEIDRKKSEQIFRSLVRELELSYEGCDWLSEDDLKAEAMDKLETVIFSNGYPDRIKRISEVDNYYKDLVVTDDYAQNLVHLWEFLKFNDLGKINVEKIDHSEWTTAPTHTTFYYSAESTHDEVGIPMGSLMRPLYDRNYPKSILFGSAGSLMGSTLIRAVLLKIFAENSDLNEDNENFDLSPNSLAKYESILECFRLQYNPLLIDKEIFDDNDIIAKAYYMAGGLDLAYKSYIKSVMDNSTTDINFKMPGLNMTGSQEFFLGYAQRQCEAIRENYMTKYLQSLPLTNHIEVNEELKNSKEFSSAFSCPYNSPMNPKLRCPFL